MQVTETNTEGLKREFKVVVPAADLDARLNDRLVALKDRVQIRGFRPGKVPVTHLKKVYGRAVMAETIEHTNRAAALGCDAALVRTPHYFKPAMTEDALAEYYFRVAEAAGIPILVYSIPIFTGITVEAPLLKRLATHPNIVGIKDSSRSVARVIEYAQLRHIWL